MSILLKSALLGDLSEMEQRSEWSAARIMILIDCMTVAIVIGCIMLDISLKNGAHEGKHIAELNRASVHAPSRPKDFS